jgi:hypothetical protein
MRTDGVRKILPLLAEKLGMTMYLDDALKILDSLHERRLTHAIIYDDYTAASAILYIPALLRDPSLWIDINDVDVKKSIRKIARSLDIPLKIFISPTAVARKLGEPEEVVRKIEELESCISPPARTARVLTAALVYLSYDILNKEVEMRDVAKRYDVTPESIRVCLRQIKREIRERCPSIFKSLSQTSTL